MTSINTSYDTYLHDHIFHKKSKQLKDHHEKVFTCASSITVTHLNKDFLELRYYL